MKSLIRRLFITILISWPGMALPVYSTSPPESGHSAIPAEDQSIEQGQEEMNSHAPAYGKMLFSNNATANVNVNASENINFIPGNSETVYVQRRPLAIVRRFNPLVIVRHADVENWVDAERTHPLHDTDTLRTGDDGFAVVQFMDNSVARVRPNSLLIVNGEVNTPGSISSRVSVEEGDMFLNIRGLNSIYEVATPSAVAAVRGTEFTTHVDETGQSSFTGFSGEVEITALSSGQTVRLTRGLRAHVDAGGVDITLSEVGDDELDSQYSMYEGMDGDLDIRTIRLHLTNDEGEVEIIEFEYYEVDSEDE
ncbi:MAG: FecR family protein [Balneolales bacterium]